MKPAALILIDSQNRLVYKKDLDAETVKQIVLEAAKSSGDRRIKARMEDEEVVGIALVPYHADITCEGSGILPIHWISFVKNGLQEKLTRSEMNVMLLKRNAHQNKSCSDSRGTEIGTIEMQLNSIYRKLNVNSILEALQKLSQPYKKP